MKFLKKNWLNILILLVCCYCLYQILDITSNSECIYNIQNQQNRNQLRINLFVFSGKVIWHEKEIKNDIKDIVAELNELSPERSYFARVIKVETFFSTKYYLVWPEFENNYK